MTREEQIAQLRARITDLSMRIADAPALKTRLRAEEDARFAEEKARGTEGYMDQTRGDWPSDGVYRSLPILEQALERTRRELAALEAPQPTPEPPKARKPTREACLEYDRCQEEARRLKERLDAPGDGSSFDNLVRGTWNSLLDSYKSRAASLLSAYPGLADPYPDMVEGGKTAPVQHPTREEIMAEPTVTGEDRKSPFPPSIERRIEAQTRGRRRRH